MKKIHEFNIMGINIQIIVTIVVLVFGILTLFFEKYFPLFQFSMGIDLLLLAYNNEKVYRRKHLTIIYTIIGVLLIVFSIFVFLGVI